MSLATKFIPNDGDELREPASVAMGGIVESLARMACVSGFVFVGEGDWRFSMSGRSDWRASLLSVSLRRGERRSRSGWLVKSDVGGSVDILNAGTVKGLEWIELSF